jgi:translation initiation factor IF-3
LKKSLSFDKIILTLRNSNQFWRLNERIPGSSFRVLDSSGKQIGILTKGDALKLAKDKGLDLIEMVADAAPPVVKMMEFGKFKYQEEKKKRESQKKNKAGDLKEIRFTPFIGEADYQTRLKRIIEFLKEKNKVKLTVYFQTKQLGSKSFGYDILKRILKDLGEGINTDMEPKFLGRNLVMIISPTNSFGKVKKNEENKS